LATKATIQALETAADRNMLLSRLGNGQDADVSKDRIKISITLDEKFPSRRALFLRFQNE